MQWCCYNAHIVCFFLGVVIKPYASAMIQYDAVMPIFFVCLIVFFKPVLRHRGLCVKFRLLWHYRMMSGVIKGLCLCYVALWTGMKFPHHVRWLIYVHEYERRRVCVLGVCPMCPDDAMWHTRDCPHACFWPCARAPSQKNHPPPPFYTPGHMLGVIVFTATQLAALQIYLVLL